MFPRRLLFGGFGGWFFDELCVHKNAAPLVTTRLVFFVGGSSPVYNANRRAIASESRKQTYLQAASVAGRFP